MKIHIESKVALKLKNSERFPSILSSLINKKTKTKIILKRTTQSKAMIRVINPCLHSKVSQLKRALNVMR